MSHAKGGYMPVFFGGYNGYLVRIDVNYLFYKEKVHNQTPEMNRIYKTILDEKQVY
jgi:hypothetical protein